MKKLGLLILLLMASMQLGAQTICAIVKIEIRQELSFERQAFDAKMVITNGLDIVSLENLDIDVYFEDIDGNPVLATSDPNNTSAKFFIRIDTMDGVNDINGSGVIAPGETAEIHWLIIPAPGTGGLTPAGLRYGVGATVSYTFGEDSQIVNVVPDFITVSPTPLLKLDYFLPADVFGDNPLTPEVEPIEPFDLGLRISNTGAGFATDLKIESAQPKIVENDQGLLIDFELLGTSVNDAPVTNSLLADIGRLDAGQSAMVSWRMQSSLNGEFISFEADFVHSDELGGQLTSLIDAPIDTHVLFHRVKVDYTGRDQIRDFLAYDEEVLRVYESNGGQAQVIDESSTTVVTNLGIVDGKQKYQINFNSVVGAGFVRWIDPYAGVIQKVTVFRSDGKLLPVDNVWQYKIETDPGVFEFYFGIFDVDSTGQYELIVNGVEPNVAPEISVVSPQNGEADTQMLFNIQVTDVNISDTLTLVSIGAPATASISHVSGSTWQFSWLPQQADIGSIDFTLIASDGITQTNEPMQLIISPAGFVDTDGDGMDDAWEQTHFGNLDKDGTGDHDQDSASDLQEYNFGGDPTIEDRPDMPQIVTPLAGSTSNMPVDDFIVINSNSAVAANVVYQFELYAEQISTTALAIATVAETNIQTAWAHGVALTENQNYIWRVRAFDGATPSIWNYDSFRYSSANNAPFNCAVDSPHSLQALPSNQVSLSVIAATDLDSDSLLYRFQIFSDVGLSVEIANSGWLDADTISTNNGLSVQWRPYVNLDDNTSFYWSASVKDETTTVDCGNAVMNIDSAFTLPSEYMIESPQLEILTDTDTLLVVNHEPNANNAGNYDYFIELDTVATFTSPQLQQSPALGVDVNNQVTWPVAGLQSDTLYYWRAKAHDGIQDGNWVYASFRTNSLLTSPIVQSINPSNGSWVTSLTPKLSFQADQRVKNISNFVIEIYSDAAASNLLFSETITSNQWITPELTDRQYFYWQLKANLADGTSSDYVSLQQFFIIDDQVNNAPAFEFVSLLNAEENTADNYNIQWLDADDDSDASIELYYDDNATGADGVLIVAGISENDVADNYNWDTSSVANGEYYLYAMISDGLSSFTVYSDASLTITHHDIGITINGDTTSESGDSLLVNVVLSKAPADYVLIPVAVSDPSEAVLDNDQLIFTPDNWNVVQQITVTGIDDSINDGDQSYDLLFANIQSTDQNYASIVLNAIPLTNTGDGDVLAPVDIVMEKNIVSTGPYSVGDNVIYELIISNIGTDEATDVIVTDSMTNLSLVSVTGANCLPANTFPCTILSIPASTSQTITLTASIDALGAFDNSASAFAAEADADISNNTDNAGNNGISTGLGPNLAVTINNCESSLSLNQDVLYKLTVMNVGDLDINGATLANTLSVYLDNISWSCQAFNGAICPQTTGNTGITETLNLPVASSVTYLISAAVIGAYNDVVESSASITMPAGISDINLTNNTDIDSDVISAAIFSDSFEETSTSQCN